MLKKGRYAFAYPSFFLNLCYKTYFFSWIICRFSKCPYLCNVFFIVLDLRLTKVGVQRYSFFYARTSRMNLGGEVMKSMIINDYQSLSIVQGLMILSFLYHQFAFTGNLLRHNCETDTRQLFPVPGVD